MREYIKKQLEKVSFADLSNFDATSNVYHIPRYTKPSFSVNKCYIIQIPKYLVNNNESILATNWNNSTSPSSQFLKIFVVKTFGRNIYVDSIAFDIDTKQDLNQLWSGWLNIDDIKQLGEI